MSVAVELREVSRSFGDVRAVDNVSLSIDDGEFFSMLGPSGSGKTTCLRLIGGFDLPSAGQIFLHGNDASDLPPYERDVNTVFQDYALFPHLSVLDNVAYGLRMRGVGREARRREAAAALEQVALGGLGGRHPGQLSGGQRQRVALARALVNRPRVLLLDEPLGALDLKLREQMQVELKGLQRRLGITFIYVTHDQGEALSMSDRVAVFNGGRVEQVDRPRDLYMRPRTTFVAGFVGTANVLTGELARRITGTDRPVAIRPERVTFGAPGPGQLGIAGSVIDVQFHGPTSRFEIEAAGARLAVTIANRDGDPDGARPEPGDAVQLAWSPDAMVELRGPATSDDDDRAARLRLELLRPAEPALPRLSDITPEASPTPLEPQPPTLEPSATRLHASATPELAATPTDSKPIESIPHHDSGPTPLEAVATPTDSKPREPSEPDAMRIESNATRPISTAVDPDGRHDSGLTPLESLMTPTDSKPAESIASDATRIESKPVEPGEPDARRIASDATRIESSAERVEPKAIGISTAIGADGRHDSRPTPIESLTTPMDSKPAEPVESAAALVKSDATRIESNAEPIEPTATRGESRPAEAIESDATRIESNATRIVTKSIAPAGRHDSGPTPIEAPTIPMESKPAEPFESDATGIESNAERIESDVRIESEATRESGATRIEPNTNDDAPAESSSRPARRAPTDERP